MSLSSVPIEARQEEGSRRYVSSAYFTTMCIGQTRNRSEATMLYDEGPKPDEAGVDIGNSDVSPAYLQTMEQFCRKEMNQ